MDVYEGPDYEDDDVTELLIYGCRGFLGIRLLKQVMNQLRYRANDTIAPVAR